MKQRKIYFQSVVPAKSHTIINRTMHGVDVLLLVNGGFRTLRNVSENAVRCILGTGYDYFFNRNIKQAGVDISCRCSEGDLMTLKNSPARHDPALESPHQTQQKPC